MTIAERISDHDLKTCEGFLPRIKRLLAEEGITLDFANHRRIAATNIADRAEVQRLSILQEHSVQVFRRNRLVRLSVRSESETLDSLDLICQLFPHAEIVVLAKTKRQSKKVSEHLIKKFGQPVRRGGDVNSDSGARITVGPPTKKTLSLISMPMILVVLDVDDLLNKRGEELFHSLMDHCTLDRLIGFQSDIKQRPYPEMYREAIFGPKRYRTARWLRQVMVAFALAPRQDKLHHTNALERKGRRIWSSGVRNDRVASLASAIAQGQIWKLERYGIYPEVIQYLSRPFKRVIILVENLVHAQELQCRLPGWGILAKGVSSPVLPSQNDNIVTISYAAHHGLNADIIIQAVGGVDSVPRPWLKAARETRAESPIVVIDLFDQIPVELERQTQERKLHHHKQGYHVFDPLSASHDVD
ncbi:MAG: hypothetical protein JNJ77_18640 [Planctomycetia bacterium]|nr:hypothetical protein [Planctomycetia bacterium]